MKIRVTANQIFELKVTPCESGLDPVTKAVLVEALRNLREDGVKTVVIEKIE